MKTLIKVLFLFIILLKLHGTSFSQNPPDPNLILVPTAPSIFDSTNYKYNYKILHIPTHDLPGNYQLLYIINDSKKNILYLRNHNSHNTANYWDWDWDGTKATYTTLTKIDWTGPNILEKGYINLSVRQVYPQLPFPNQENEWDFHTAYIKVGPTFGKATYNYSYFHIYTHPFGPTYRYEFGTTIILRKPIPVPEEFIHYHSIKNSSIFKTKRYISNETFQICADGSSSSYFKVEFDTLVNNWDHIKLSIREDEANDPDLNGKILEVKHIDPRTLEFHFQHPSKIDTDNPRQGITIDIHYQDEEDTVHIGSYPIWVRPAPVLLVHGLWSKSTSFSEMAQNLKQSPIYIADPYLIRAVDFSESHMKSFDYNLPIIKNKIDDFINYLLTNFGVAAGNIDYVGHSMGGILGRMYLQSDIYECGIHKLITINSPHSGTQLANLIIDNFDIACNIVLPSLSFINAGPDACMGDAIDNLRVDSPMIRQILNGNRLRYRTVPSHTISTVQSILPNDIFLYYLVTSSLLNPIPNDVFTNIIWFLVTKANPAVLYGGPNDLIVPLVSQRGGMVGNCTSTFEDQMHLGSQNSQLIIQQVKNLLSLPYDSDAFCSSFNPVSLEKPQNYPTASGGNISIISPIPGQILQSGSNINIASTGGGLSDIITILTREDNDEVLIGNKQGNSSQTTYESYITGKRSVLVIGNTAGGANAVDTSYFEIQNLNICESLRSGEWWDTTIWSCGYVPSTINQTIINSGHIVTFPTGTLLPKSLLLNGTLLIK